MTPYGSVNLTEMVLEHPFRFLTLLRTSEMSVKPLDYLLPVCEILRHCEDNAYVLSRSLYRSHVLTTFLGPVLGAMMKQVCWHSRRSKAYRGLPEARGQSEAHGDSNLSI